MNLLSHCIIRGQQGLDNFPPVQKYNPSKVKARLDAVLDYLIWLKMSLLIARGWTR